MFNDIEKYYLYLNLTNIFNFVINKYKDIDKLQEYISYLYNITAKIETYFKDKYTDMNETNFYSSWIFYQMQKLD